MIMGGNLRGSAHYFLPVYKKGITTQGLCTNELT